MNLELVDKIANAVLYEGYLLYPYRPTAVKNQQRWNFGVLYPQAFADANSNESSTMQTECIVLANASTELAVRVRFLHLLQRQIGVPSSEAPETFELVAELEVDGKRFQSWQEAVDREVVLTPIRIDDLHHEPSMTHFEFVAGSESEPLCAADGKVVGNISREWETIAGSITLNVTKVSDGVTKLSVRILNLTELSGDLSRERALMGATISTHTILSLKQGEFVSQLDPPEEFRDAVSSCTNAGAWPVLVGADEAKNTMLSSPIILYDYPTIAPESAGDLFDGTEIDEILTLRIMALTDEEKRQMRGADERAQQILERTETLPVEQFMKMHGAVRGLKRMKAEG